MKFVNQLLDLWKKEDQKLFGAFVLVYQAKVM